MDRTQVMVAKLQKKLMAQRDQDSVREANRAALVEKFRLGVALATEDVSRGQHLRFIGLEYRTKEVCLVALRHEVSHNNRPYDIASVPVAHIEEVVDTIKRETPGRESLHAHLEAEMEDRQRRATEPGYFDHPWTCTQDVVAAHGATSWDDMLEKAFVRDREDAMAAENKCEN